VKRSLWLAVATLGVALLGIALACGRERIPVATIEPDRDASIPCEISDAGDVADACGEGWYCSATSCSAKDGTCAPIAPDGCASFGPECGCDGISYYNSCVRQRAGVSSAGQGQCEYQMGIPGVPCGPKLACPGGMSCAFLFSLPQLPTFLDGAVPDDVECRIAQNLEGVGVCWALPNACPDSSSLLVRSPCGSTCIEGCAAIRNGGPYTFCAPDGSAGEGI
jgi:hypothetical protein